MIEYFSYYITQAVYDFHHFRLKTKMISFKYQRFWHFEAKGEFSEKQYFDSVPQLKHMNYISDFIWANYSQHSKIFSSAELAVSHQPIGHGLLVLVEVHEVFVVSCCCINSQSGEHSEQEASGVTCTHTQIYKSWRSERKVKWQSTIFKQLVLLP